MIEIMKSESVISAEALYSLCIRHRWFTCGTNRQYAELFNMLRDGASLDELALVIWICSDGFDREEIREELHRVAEGGAA